MLTLSSRRSSRWFSRRLSGGVLWPRAQTQTKTKHKWSVAHVQPADKLHHQVLCTLGWRYMNVDAGSISRLLGEIVKKKKKKKLDEHPTHSHTERRNQEKLKCLFLTEGWMRPSMSKAIEGFLHPTRGIWIGIEQHSGGWGPCLQILTAISICPTL